MGALARRLLPGVQVYALDTFSGMPETDQSIDAHGAGDFGDADYEEIIAARSRFGGRNFRRRRRGQKGRMRGERRP